MSPRAGVGIPRSPLVVDAERLEAVWAACNSVFAVDLVRCRVSASLENCHAAPIRSLDIFHRSAGSRQTGDTGLQHAWVTSGDDKQVLVLGRRDQDDAVSVVHRLLLGKRAQGVCVAAEGDALLWGDKFGDLFRATIADLERETADQVRGIRAHIEANENDDFFRNIAGTVLAQFDGVGEAAAAKGEPAAAGDASPELTPFAGHLSGVTCVSLNAERSLIFTGDRDEKVRVGGAKKDTCFHTVGYALHHSEFVTCVLPLKLPARTPGAAELHGFVTAAADQRVCLWSYPGPAAADLDQHTPDAVRLIASAPTPGVPSSIALVPTPAGELVDVLLVCETADQITPTLHVIPIEVSCDSSSDSSSVGSSDVSSKVSSGASRNGSAAASPPFRFSDGYSLEVRSQPQAIAVLPQLPREVAEAWVREFRDCNGPEAAASGPNLNAGGPGIAASGPVLFAANRSGELEPPSLLERREGRLRAVDICSAAAWRERVATGPRSTPLLDVWKHSRLPDAPSTEERRQKRLKRPAAPEAAGDAGATGVTPDPSPPASAAPAANGAT